MCSIWKRNSDSRTLYLTNLGTVEFERYTRFLWSVLTLKRFSSRYGARTVFCVKSLAPHLLGKLFTVRTDCKNLVYLSNSTVLKLVRWRVLLSEFRFQIEHIPGAQNMVADELTRVFHMKLKNRCDIASKMIQRSVSFAWTNQRSNFKILFSATPKTTN